MAGSTTNGFPYPSGTDKVRDGDDLIKMLAEAIEAKLMPTAWTAITPLTSGFTARTGYYAPSYRVFPNGRVELRGGIDKSSSIISGNIPFVLPAAARPSVNVAVVCGMSRTGVTYPATARLDINPTNGNVVVADVDASGPTWMSLDGVTFCR